MKNAYLLLSFIFCIFLSSCASPGSKKVSFDDFSGTERTETLIGTLKSATSQNAGMMNNATLFFITEESATLDNQSKDLFFSINTYCEALQNCSMSTKKGNKVVFLIDDYRHGFKLRQDAAKHGPISGLLSPAWVEKIEIGPLDESIINRIAFAKEIKLKIYGNRYSKEYLLSEKQVELLRNEISSVN